MTQISESATSTIIFTVEGHVARITLDRPERLNTLSPGLLDDVDSVLDRIESDDAVRVLVITGKGRAFCAGADLSHEGSATQDDSAAVPDTIPLLKRIQKLLVRLHSLPIPVVVGINGIAMGGGLELALAADVVVAAAGAKIGDGHLNVGVLPGGGNATVLPRRVGLGLANYLILTGDILRAEDLHRAGLIAKIYPVETFDEDLRSLAARIAEKSPLAARAVKRLVGQGLLTDDYTEALRLELTAGQAHARTHDMAEGVRAFREKRRPEFIGR